MHAAAKSSKQASKKKRKNEPRKEYQLALGTVFFSHNILA
jgi:hypothetical protein